MGSGLNRIGPVGQHPREMYTVRHSGKTDCAAHSPEYRKFLRRTLYRRPEPGDGRTHLQPLRLKLEVNPRRIEKLPPSIAPS